MPTGQLRNILEHRRLTTKPNRLCLICKEYNECLKRELWGGEELARLAERKVAVPERFNATCRWVRDRVASSFDDSIGARTRFRIIPVAYSINYKTEREWEPINKTQRYERIVVLPELQVDIEGHPSEHFPAAPDVGPIQTSLVHLLTKVIFRDVCASTRVVAWSKPESKIVDRIRATIRGVAACALKMIKLSPFLYLSAAFCYSKQVTWYCISSYRVVRFCKSSSGRMLFNIRRNFSVSALGVPQTLRWYGHKVLQGSSPWAIEQKKPAWTFALIVFSHPVESAISHSLALTRNDAQSPRHSIHTDDPMSLHYYSSRRNKKESSSSVLEVVLW